MRGLYGDVLYSVEMMSKDYGRHRLGIHRFNLGAKEITFISYDVPKSAYTGIHMYYDLGGIEQKSFDIPMIKMDIPVLKPEHRPLDFKAMTEAVIAWLKDNTRVVTCNEHEKILGRTRLLVESKYTCSFVQAPLYGVTERIKLYDSYDKKVLKGFIDKVYNNKERATVINLFKEDYLISIKCCPLHDSVLINQIKVDDLDVINGEYHILEHKSFESHILSWDVIYNEIKNILNEL